MTRQLTIVLRGAVLLAALLFAAGMSPAGAAEVLAPMPARISIDPQPLAAALQAFSAQSGLQVGVEAGLATGLKSQGTHGAKSFAEALDALLNGTGLEYRFINDRTVVIRKKAAPQTSAASLERVTWLAPAAGPGAASAANDAQRTQAEDDVEGEMVVTSTFEGLAAMRVPTAWREIPQSVSIITRETLEQQNANDLEDAMAYATGITLTQTGTNKATLFSRGFAVTSYHVDGGAAIRMSGTGGLTNTPDLSQFDRIEVLRGADALFGGNADPGATVSLVRKRPGNAFSVNTSVLAGSWDTYRLEADVTGPMAQDGALRGRFGAVVESNDYYFDISTSRRKKLYTMLEYGLSPETLLSVGGSFERNHVVPTTFGLPRYDNGDDPHFPRSTAFALPWTSQDSDNWEAFAQLRHRFSDTWALNVSATQLGESGRGAAFAFPQASINPDTGLWSGFAFATTGLTDADRKQSSADATLTGGFDWRGRRQELMFGMDYSYGRVIEGDSEAVYYFSYTVNPFNFDPASQPGPGTGDFSFAGPGEAFRVKQYGGYAALRLRPFERWSFIAGVRNSSVEYSTPASNGTQVNSKYDNKLTPSFGVTYDINKTYSLYASYADIYRANPDGRTSVPFGAPLAPADGVNMEVGLKAALTESGLNASVALFRIEQEGVPVNIGSDPDDQFCCFISGTNRSKGAELELSGAVRPGWLLTTGYTYNINENTSGGVLNTYTPKHLFKVWTSYQLPAGLDRWNVGGGVLAQSENYVNGFGCPSFDGMGNCNGNPYTPFRIVQGSYAVVNLRVGYDINPRWSAALNVNNALDRVYFQTIGNTMGGNQYGEPRNVMFKLQGRF